MYFNNLKRLRNNKKLTQTDIANYLKVKRSTYVKWEQGFIIIPIDKTDELSILYNVRLS